MTLFGCVGPNNFTPLAPSVANYTVAPQPRETSGSMSTGGGTQHFRSAESIDGQWWKTFGAETLNELVQQTLDHNPTLTQARMKVVQAQQDYAAQAGGTTGPQIDAKLSGAREKVDPAVFGIPNIKQPPPFTLFNASVSVFYNLDLFGANRRALESLAAQIDYQQFQLAAARATLAGNVVTTVVRRASAATQLALVERMLAAADQQLAVTEQRVALGGVSRVELLSLRIQNQQTRAMLAPLRQQMAQADHQLSIYMGRAPGTPPVATAGVSTLDPGAINLDSLVLPTDLPLTLPSALAHQRPDIRAAEALLAQASANVGVASANLYPQITLSGNAGSERTRVADLVKGLNVWNAGLALTQPLFHGGQLHARKRSAEAAYQAALAYYQQTVLQGLQQVADTLRALQHDADELQARDEAARAAKENADIAQQRFDLGGISRVDLLETQRQSLQATVDRSKVLAQRFADTAGLYQALGAQ